MQQRELLGGFSELKDLLIRTFKIERDRAFVKLYFSEKGTELLMHDYDDHKKVIVLSRNKRIKDIHSKINSNSYKLLRKALSHPYPSEFLNEEFKLNGFFIS